jgi:hypothetical protein
VGRCKECDCDDIRPARLLAAGNIEFACGRCGAIFRRINLRESAERSREVREDLILRGTSSDAASLTRGQA